MRVRSSTIWVILVVCWFVTAAAGQNSMGDAGRYELFGVGSSHDSSVGWTTELDTGLGYDLNRALSVQTGIPLYLVTASSTTSTTGTTQPSQQFNSLGDAYVALNLHPKLDSYKFTLALTGTVPTGSRTNGISTGRATATLGGRIEKDFDRVTPFAEGTFGNSLGSTNRVHRPYTTLGAVSTFTGGASFDITKRLSFEASGYDTLPFGDQKVYSHKGKQASGGNGKRPFEQAAVTSGGASLTKDHGFSGNFDFAPTRRVSVDAGYTRSIAFALDTMSVGVSFRLGHMTEDKPVRR